MNLTYEHFTSEHPVSFEIAKDISNWSQALPGAMLPLTPPSIQNEAFAVVAFDGPAALGHVAITRLEGKTTVNNGSWLPKQEQIGNDTYKAAIIGGLVVNPAKQGGAIGAKLIQELLTHADEHLQGHAGYRAYANPKSLKLFMALGGILHGTRHKSASTNCNWVVDMTPAQQKLTAAKLAKMVY